MEDLEERLLRLKTREETERYIEDLKKSKRHAYFYQYLNQYAGAKNIPIKEIIDSSEINKNYVYNIVNGRRKYPGRDKIIALCIGASMNYEETNRGLETGGYCRLQPHQDRDVWIAVAVNTGNYNIQSINDQLEAHGLKPLEI